ncbi:MAG: hypothetical protein WBM86_26955, partial [Waterburya sp.]
AGAARTASLAQQAIASGKNPFWLEKTKSIQSKALRYLCQAVSLAPYTDVIPIRGYYPHSRTSPTKMGQVPLW